MSGGEPYSTLGEDEVERRFENMDFPTSDHLGYGTVFEVAGINASLQQNRLYKV